MVNLLGETLEERKQEDYAKKQAADDLKDIECRKRKATEVGTMSAVLNSGCETNYRRAASLAFPLWTTCIRSYQHEHS